MHDDTTNLPSKQCRDCGKSFPVTSEHFVRNASRKDGFSTYCKSCSKVRHTESNRKRGHKPRNQCVIENGLRRCTKCGEWKVNTSEYFFSSETHQDGLRPDCKVCVYKRQKQWRKEHPEEQNKRERNYRASWSEEYRATIRARDRVYSKLYHHKNRERCIANMRIYGIQNRDKFRERNRKYRANNPELARARDRRRYENGKKTIISQRRRARKESLPATLTYEQWQYALEYFGHCCAVCGNRKGLWHTIVQDHWIPLSKGGGTTAENIVPLCHSKKDGEGGCNNEKHHQNPKTWLQNKYGKRKATQILKRIQDYFDSLK